MCAISIPLLSYTVIGGSFAKEKKMDKGGKNHPDNHSLEIWQMLTFPLPSIGSIQMLLAHEDVSLASVPSVCLTKTLLFCDVKGTQWQAAESPIKDAMIQGTDDGSWKVTIYRFSKWRP